MKTAFKTLVAGITAVVVLALVAAFVGLPSIGNPFASETEVRDHAAILQSLEEIAVLITDDGISDAVASQIEGAVGRLVVVPARG